MFHCLRCLCTIQPDALSWSFSACIEYQFSHLVLLPLSACVPMYMWLHCYQVCKVKLICIHSQLSLQSKDSQENVIGILRSNDLFVFLGEVLDILTKNLHRDGNNAFSICAEKSKMSCVYIHSFVYALGLSICKYMQLYIMVLCFSEVPVSASQ